MEFIIKPINDIDICNQILRDCELYDNVLAITSNNSEISEIVSILFTYVSESIAVGTKMTYLNNTAEEIAAFKRDNGLSVKSPTPKSFKHNKRSFISTVKSNKEFILAQIKVNFEPTLESVHKNPETTSTEENNNIEVNSEPSNKRSFFHRIFKKRK